MDEKRRAALVARMGQVAKYNGGVAAAIMPLVPLETYFDGSEGQAPLLCNSPAEPDNDTVLGLWLSVRDRPDVHDVRIAIVNCGDGEWPFSDKVVVVTSAHMEDLIGWFPEGFQPDDIWEGDVEHLPAEEIEVPPGFRKLWLWYD